MDLRSSRSRSRSTSSSRSSSRSISPSSFDDFCLGAGKLPPSTSHWNRLCLDTLGIYYHTEFLASPFDVLAIATRNTGCFGAVVHGDQKQYLDLLQEKLVFNISKRDFHELLFDTNSTRQRLNEFLEEINDQTKENFSSEGPSYLVYELLHDIANILRYEAAEHEHCRIGQGPASEDLYKTAFTHFARMCWIEALPGSLWKSKMKVCKTDVTSTADILLMPIKSPLHLCDNIVEAETVSVVSVLKARNKKMSGDYSEGASIYDYICPDVLAKHGGDLLLHMMFYSKKLFPGKQFSYVRAFPGMIVLGTEVIFTCLLTDGKHLSEVCSKEAVDRKVKIYYSKPRDYLKKEDRDILMEAIIRLNNI